MAVKRARWPTCGCTEAQHTTCVRQLCHKERGREGRNPSGDLNLPAVTSAFANLAKREENQRRMRLLLKCVADCPMQVVFCHKSGVPMTALRYWLGLSRIGRKGDGFDISLAGGRTERFHILFEDALMDGTGHLELAAYKAATGRHKEVLTYQGEISYQYEEYEDFDFITGETTIKRRLKRDENGDLVPVSVDVIDFEMTRFMLKTLRKEKYGSIQQIDVNHKVGGVLVVGAAKTSKQLEADYKNIRHDNVVDVEFEEVEDPSETDPKVSGPVRHATPPGDPK